MHKPEGQCHLEQALKIQLMKVRFQILLVCSMKCHVVQWHVDWKIPRRQETLYCHIEHTIIQMDIKNSVHFSEFKIMKEIFIF